MVVVLEVAIVFQELNCSVISTIDGDRLDFTSTATAARKHLLE